MNLSNKCKIIILIPVYNPNDFFVDFVMSLAKQVRCEVVVVNDGSACKKVFEILNTKQGVHLVTHKDNQGKGAALKTGFTYIIKNRSECDYVITVDADNQHSIKDIIKVINQLNAEKKEMVVGSREFNSNTPLKSRIGNYATRCLFALFTGKLLKDTQTGLRAIPVNTLASLIKLQGARFEFELEVLFWCIINRVEIREVSISAIYFEKNKRTNFRPILDSFRVYKTLVKYFLGNILSLNKKMN